MAKYDWKRRTELLMQEVGRFLAYKVANDGANMVEMTTINRGEKLVLRWSRAQDYHWVSLRIVKDNEWNLLLDLKLDSHLTVMGLTIDKDSWKKLYKRLERILSKHLMEEHSANILQSADDSYARGATCVKN